MSACHDIRPVVEGVESRTPVDPSNATPQPDRDRLRVGMALYGDLTYDSRVRKEARSLAEAGFDVTIVCLAAGEMRTDLPANVTILVRQPTGALVIPGSPNPFFAGRAGHIDKVRRRISWLVNYARGLRKWGRLAVEAAGPVDAWHAHDLTGLAAISPNVPRAIPLLYDSHELFLETGTALRLPALARRMLRAYERRLISRVAAVVTVNEAVASVLRRRYRPARIVAVHNCPDRWEGPAERPTVLRAAVGIPVGSPIILYHGALSANRGIEQLMQAMLEHGLGGVHLVLMGSGEKRDAYLRASSGSSWGGRVHVLDPVLPTELLDWVASADVGAMPFQPATLNLRLSTPNKLFECLAAGTPVVASDFPALREIIVGSEGGPLGGVCDPESVPAVAAALRSILALTPADMAVLRARCSLAAAERWNWDREAQTLLSVYAKILPRHG